MYDSIDYLIILHCAEEETLGAVASRIGRDVSRISIRLRDLERKVGATLVIRRPKLILTDEGRIFLAAARVMRSETERMAVELRTHRAHRSDNLRIMCDPAIMIDDLPLALDVLRRERPGVRISVQSGNFSEIAESVESGIIDVGLLPFAPSKQGLSLTAYKTARICIIVPVGHQLAQRPGPIYFSEALNYEFVGVLESKRMSAFLDARAADSGGSIVCSLRVDSLDAQAVLVAQTSFGVGATIECVARRALDSPLLRMVRLSDEWAVQTFYTVTKKGASGVVSEFVSLLQARFERR